MSKAPKVCKRFTKLPDSVKEEMAKLYYQGVPSRIIALNVNLGQRMVLKYLSTLSSKSRWSDNEIRLLTKAWGHLPSRSYTESQIFKNLVADLKRTETAIIAMAFQLGLVRNVTHDRTESYNNDEEPIRMIRPPAQYTNIKTPYGIATELHANGIEFVEQCKFHSND